MSNMALAPYVVLRLARPQPGTAVLSHVRLSSNRTNGSAPILEVGGQVPGPLTLSSSGVIGGSFERSVDGSVEFLGNSGLVRSAFVQAEWDSGQVLNGNGRSFTLYLLPKASFEYSQEGSFAY